jgi:hypothetical protein
VEGQVKPTLDSLIALVGQPVDSAAVQALIHTARLQASAVPEEVHEGGERRCYLSSPEGGYELIHTNGRVVTVFLHLRPGEGLDPFQGSLLGDLSAQSTRDSVRGLLGRPSRSGEAETIPVLRRRRPWDRYDSPTVCIHFEYTEDGELIQRITVMATDFAP